MGRIMQVKLQTRAVDNGGREMKVGGRDGQDPVLESETKI